MSSQVFPALPGLGWSVIRTPVWSTIKHKSVSGRALRASYFSYPLYKYSLTYDVLRAGNGFTELQTLVGFFNAMRGAGDTFLYSDPADNSVTAQSFGIGDGTTTAFQLVRTLGGYVEPIYDFNGAPAISVGGVLKTLGADYTINLSGGLRTNLLTYSEQFDQWTAVDIAVTANGATDPIGGSTADVLTFAALTTAHIQRFAGSIPVNGSYTLSVWLKSVSGSTSIRFGIATQPGGQYINVTTPTMTVGSWVRYSVTFAVTGITTDTDINFFIDGLADGASRVVYAWGAQLEQSASMTGYIKTTTQPVSALDPGTVIFNAPPAAAAALTWTGAYYRRCAFQKDESDFENFMKDLWLNKKVEIESVKP